MLSPALTFRPASVVARLPARSGACPLSSGVLLGAAAEAGIVLPLVRAPIAAVARGALVAAKELNAVVGLELPAKTPPRPWFDAVAAAADEVAAGLPVFLSAELVVEGEGPTQVERAVHAAFELVDAGMTHLALDVAPVSVGERGRVAGEIAQAGLERGIGVEIILPLGERHLADRAVALFDEVAGLGLAPDFAGVRCPAPAEEEEAKLQAGALARISQALAGVPVLRRGPITPRLLELLRASPVRGCDDGGAAARATGLVEDMPGEVGSAEEKRESVLERAAARLPAESADRLEARAYVEAVDFIERLGGSGGAPKVTQALARSLVDL